MDFISSILNFCSNFFGGLRKIKHDEKMFNKKLVQDDLNALRGSVASFLSMAQAFSLNSKDFDFNIFISSMYFITTNLYPKTSYSNFFSEHDRDACSVYINIFNSDVYAIRECVLRGDRNACADILVNGSCYLIKDSISSDHKRKRSEAVYDDEVDIVKGYERDLEDNYPSGLMRRGPEYVISGYFGFLNKLLAFNVEGQQEKNRFI